MANVDNTNDNSDVDVDVSFSSSDEGDDNDNSNNIIEDNGVSEEEQEDEENLDEFADYWYDLLDEEISKHLDRNPPNWSSKNYQDFNVPDYS